MEMNAEKDSGEKNVILWTQLVQTQLLETVFLSSFLAFNSCKISVLIRIRNDLSVHIFIFVTINDRVIEEGRAASKSPH